MTAIEKAGTTDSDKVKDTLYEIEYEGVTGHTKFDENGDVDKEFVKVTIKDGKFVKWAEKGWNMLTQQIFNGLALGMGYALIAVGYSLVFGILRLVNFSHGSIYAFGAEMSMVFIGLNFGIVPGIIASMIVTGILGVTIDKIALEPLRKKKSMPIASLITTIGVSNIVTNLLIIFLGSEKRNFPQLFNFGTVKLVPS